MMPLVRPVDPGQLTGAAQEAYKELEEFFAGHVPLPWRTMANVPHWFVEMWAQAKAIRQPSEKLDAKTKEVVSYVVAAVNGCRFCMTSHGGALKKKYDFTDADLTELAALVAFWSQMNRFNIGLMLDPGAPAGDQK